MSVNDEKPTPASITAMERALLLALALKWRKQSDVLNVEQIKDLEREIWVSHIHSAMEEMENSVREYYMVYLLWMIFSPFIYIVWIKA